MRSSGLRLGIISSADNELIKFIKNDVSIWNINSIAEFYMQICEKYNDEYKHSLDMLKEVRNEFLKKLMDIKYLRVIPTQANFVMCEVLGIYSATQLTELLLNDYNIFIKDLSMKKGISGQYIRIAIKTKEENDMLICIFHKLFSDKKSL